MRYDILIATDEAFPEHRTRWRSIRLTNLRDGVTKMIKLKRAIEPIRKVLEENAAAGRTSL